MFSEVRKTGEGPREDEGDGSIGAALSENWSLELEVHQMHPLHVSMRFRSAGSGLQNIFSSLSNDGVGRSLKPPQTLEGRLQVCLDMSDRVSTCTCKFGATLVDRKLNSLAPCMLPVAVLLPQQGGARLGGVVTMCFELRNRE